MPRLLSRWLAIAWFVIFPLPLLGQAGSGGEVRGTVRDDATGTPIAGAMVTLPGTTVGTITDRDGAFLLEGVGAGGREIRIAHPGYAATSVPVQVTPTGRIDLQVLLAPSAIALDEVVVTGTAGARERRSRGAVVASIAASAIAESVPVTSIEELLTARTPGVSTGSASGTPGTAHRVRIRGSASLSLSNDPLVYIDGIRADSRNQEFFSIGGQFTSRLADLRPEDIESIEVVKGPAAATLYGADASAGVIQIITKRGRPGEAFRQTVLGEYHTIDRTWDPEDNFARCSGSAMTRPICAGEEEGAVVRDNPLLRNDVLREGAYRSLLWTGRGGGQTYGYYLSVGVDEEMGIFPDNEFGRSSARANFDFMPSDRWRIEAGFGLSRSDNRLPINDNNVYGFLGGSQLGNALTAGTAPNDGWYAARRGPAAIAAIENDIRVTRVIPTLQFHFLATPAFTHRLVVGGDLTRAEATQFYPRNDSLWYAAALNDGEIRERRQNSDRLTLEYMGRLRHSFADDRLGAGLSFGSQLIAVRIDELEAIGTGLPSNASRNIGSSTQRSADGNFSERRSVGFFGTLDFDWENRLFLNLAARTDRDSAFGEAADAFFLPAANLSWVISEEAFFQPLLGVVSGLRLRGGFGTTGRSPSPGAALRTYDPSPYAIAATTASGLVPLNPGNFRLLPERGREIEAGFDLDLLDGRVGAEVTFFDKSSTDVLVQRPLAPSEGFTQNPWTNLAEVRNRGWEFAVTSGIVRTTNFSWDAQASLTLVENELTDLGGQAPIGSLNRHVEGYPLGGFWSQKVESIDTTGATCPTNAAGNRPPACAFVTPDLVYHGEFNPTQEGTFSSTVTLFGNLRITGLLDWKKDFLVYNNTRQFRDRLMGSSEDAVRRGEMAVADRVSRWGPFYDRSRATSESAGIVTVPAASIFTPYLEDGSFVRLREVGMTLSLPDEWARRVGASGAMLTLGARNLKLWTDYSGADPEVISQGIPGFSREEFLTVPPTRRYTARLSFSF